jgi:hypothetical protein
MLGGCSLTPKKAGVEIITNVPAKVYLDGREAGSTPYKNTSLKPGEIEVRLEAGENNWSRKVNLFNYTNTVIDWDFGSIENESGGYVVTMERTGNIEKASLLVNAIPDKSAVAVDNEIKGFSPALITDLGEGDKQVKISFPGYKSLNLFVKGIKDYQLIVNAKLATEKRVETVVPTEPVSTPGAVSGEKVQIGETETGWLRVRAEANSTSIEVAKVNPGEKYPVLERDNGWVKIDLGSNKSGWVSGTYAKNVEE